MAQIASQTIAPSNSLMVLPFAGGDSRRDFRSSSQVVMGGSMLRKRGRAEAARNARNYCHGAAARFLKKCIGGLRKPSYPALSNPARPALLQ